MAIAACQGEVGPGAAGGPGGDPPGTPPPGPGMTPAMEVPPEPNPNALSNAELFECRGEATSSPSRIRRIERLEWTRAVGARERDTAALNPLVPNSIHRYSTWSHDESFDPVMLDRFLGIVAESGTDWTGNADKPNELRCMWDEGTVPDRSCVESFVAYYLPRHVLHRPSTPDEEARLVTFALEVLADADATGRSRAEAMTKISSAAWLTTGALYRPETGQGEALVGGDRALSAHELGLAFSYALTDWAPGGHAYRSRAQLGPEMLVSVRDAIDDGSIFQPATIEALIAEHLGGTDGARPDLEQDDRWRSRRGEFWLNQKVLRFFQEWLDYRSVNTIFKDSPAATSAHEGAENIDRGYSQLLRGYYGYEATIDAQLDDMIARIVVADTDVLRTLLTSRTFYLPSNLSDGFKSTENFHFIYGYTQDINDDRAARWVELPMAERAGVLTHPAWLAAHGGNFDNDPSVVERGKWIRENLLCGSIPDVPITVDASFPVETNHLPARDRLAMTTGADAYCQGCHQQMDPLGLPFEIYNHAGFLRADDHGSAPNGESTVLHTGDPTLDVTVRDAVDLSERFADSELVLQCFIRQVFRYFASRPETVADACTLSAMQRAYEAENGSLQAALGALMTSPTFLHRHDAPEAP
ncbi:MAG: DUF1588 domain-containing protein [Myxococcota bacterium]